MRAAIWVIDTMIKTALVIFWYLISLGLKGAIVDYAELKFKKGDIVWAYNLDPGDRTDISRVKGKLVSFYRFGDDIHWSVQDLRSKQGSRSEYKEQWLRHVEQDTQGVNE